MPKWKDVTSYSQGDKKPSPASWECSIEHYIRVVVTKQHIDYPDQWVVRIYPFAPEPEPLNLPGVAEADKAQERALEIVRDILAICVRAVGR